MGKPRSPHAGPFSQVRDFRSLWSRKAFYHRILTLHDNEGGLVQFPRCRLSNARTVWVRQGKGKISIPMFDLRKDMGNECSAG